MMLCPPIIPCNAAYLGFLPFFRWGIVVFYCSTKLDRPMIFLSTPGKSILFLTVRKQFTQHVSVLETHTFGTIICRRHLNKNSWCWVFVAFIVEKGTKDGRSIGSNFSPFWKKLTFFFRTTLTDKLYRKRCQSRYQRLKAHICWSRIKSQKQKTCRLERTSEGCVSQNPAQNRATHWGEASLHRTSSSWVSNTWSSGESVASLYNLFQCLSMLIVKQTNKQTSKKRKKGIKKKKSPTI